MNKYDEHFTFRLASTGDIDAIMTYLKKEWGEKHILANDKELFIYQYAGEGEQINFFLMLDKNNSIKGANGFVQYSNDPERRYISNAITKVSSGLPLPMCGVEMLRRFFKATRARAYFDFATNPKTLLPIFKNIFHHDTGIMQQYYIINQSINNFNILKITGKCLSRKIVESDFKLVKINNINEIEKEFNFEKNYPRLPFKSKEYFNKRFFKHPVYTYQGYAIKRGEKCYGIIFTREVEVEGSSALRIVDFAGDITVLSKIGTEIEKIMTDNNYEYVDILTNGLPYDIIKQSGFIRREEDDTNVIIPTYFEPFIQKNINLYYESSNQNLIIFKADGDQDRPNFRV